jgi:hypothetical protein
MLGSAHHYPSRFWPLGIPPRARVISPVISRTKRPAIEQPKPSCANEGETSSITITGGIFEGQAVDGVDPFVLMEH